MSTRTLTSVVTPDTVALNVFMFGYAGSSAVVPHTPLQQVWWTEDRINNTVTRETVISKFLSKDREKLGQPVSFGDGLTDDTYLEWILDKSRRLFLILSDIGIPEKIFDIIDRCWDDDDLPLTFEDVEELELGRRNEAQLVRRFHQVQYTYLLRQLYEGAHMTFGPNEVVPLEYMHKLPLAASLQQWTRVHLPFQPEERFTYDTLEAEFVQDVENAKYVEHDHIAPIWASYTARGHGFILTPFISEHTLKSFVDSRTPQQYTQLSKQERHVVIFEWMHCLADALAAIHRNGFIHTAVRPSNILIDAANGIAFSDIGSLKSFQRDKKNEGDESYNYAPPESYPSSRPYTDVTVASSDRSSEKSLDKSSEKPSTPTTPTDDNKKYFETALKKNLPPSRTAKSDIFGLGCVYLDILTFAVKKKASEFVKHRSTKKRAHGRGGSRVDASFHANLEKVHSWMSTVESAAFDFDDQIFGAVPQIIQLVRAMLSQNPDLRPTADEVRDRIYDVLMTYSRMPSLHCGGHPFDTVTSVPSISDDSPTAVERFPNQPRADSLSIRTKRYVATSFAKGSNSSRSVKSGRSERSNSSSTKAPLKLDVPQSRSENAWKQPLFTVM
ncbi:kinase-like domain-containing protein [Lineolata rhizophorae]|uniref:Kinase-like domain-containing protein n=1 Tax=Lineolata rhizophorae TaxID=578093 RepID=A0A6A6P3T4_9PEZI|nr:kinase-like domain-containing protein [Lineolata rhizophorae]